MQGQIPLILQKKYSKMQKFLSFSAYRTLLVIIPVVLMSFLTKISSYSLKRWLFMSLLIYTTVSGAIHRNNLTKFWVDNNVNPYALTDIMYLQPVTNATK